MKNWIECDYDTTPGYCTLWYFHRGFSFISFSRSNSEKLNNDELRMFLFKCLLLKSVCLFPSPVWLFNFSLYLFYLEEKPLKLEKNLDNGSKIGEKPGNDLEFYLLKPLGSLLFETKDMFVEKKCYE